MRYQRRGRHANQWLPVEEPIRYALERAGFRYSELHEHVKDLDAGHVLWTDSGVTFRLAEKEE